MPSDLDIELDAELAANPSLANPAPSAPTPQETPATPVVEQAAETPAPAPTPVPEQTPAATQEAAYAGARDYAQRALAYQQATQYGDDASFLQALVAGHQTAQQQLAEARQLAQYGQLWLQQQAQQQRPQQQAEDPLAAYKVPQFNQQWMQHVEQTPTGWKLREGGDPAALAQLNAYSQRRAEIADKFMSNPAEFLQPLVANMVQEQASKLVQESFQQNQQSQYVNGFIQQNAGWLFSHDTATGRPVLNSLTQKPIVSPAGQRFYQYLRSAEQMGITNPIAQEEYAKAKLSVDLMQPQQQQQTAVANNAGAKQQLLNQMNRNPNRSGSTVAQSGAQGLAEQNSNLSLADRMTAALRAAGETDETIAAAMAG